MFKGVFTKNYIALSTVLMKMSETGKAGLGKNRQRVQATAKVYADYRAISDKEAEMDRSLDGDGCARKEKVPTPPQHLTETQAETISAYTSSRILSAPEVINVPDVVNQPEVSTGVKSFMISCQSKYKWRLKLTKTIHSMTKYGPAGVLVIPRHDGIDMETITPGNGYYNTCKEEGMCVLNKDYDFLMDMIDLNDQSLTSLGQKIKEKPEVLHHIISGGGSNGYDMGYYQIQHNTCVDEDMSHLTPQEQSKAMIANLPVPMSLNDAKAYKGMTIQEGDCCYEDDGKFGEVSDQQKLELMSKCLAITFNTLHLDSRMANLKEIPSVGATGQGGEARQKYMIMSINGFPIWVKPVTSEMIIVSDLFLSGDNEQAKTLVEALKPTEKYNTDFHRSVILALKAIVNQDNLILDPNVFDRNKQTGKLEIKSFENLNGDKVDFRQHLFEATSPANDIQAITQTLPAPNSYADEVTGNNALMSSQHVKGNRTQVEGQRLTQNSESRFFVYAAHFYMSIINPFSTTCIDHLVARPSWVEVINPQPTQQLGQIPGQQATPQDEFIPASVGQMAEYVKNYYREQTGLIPSNSGDPQIAQFILQMIANDQQLSTEYDKGEIMAYFAKTGGWEDFPKVRRPHLRGQPIGTGGQSTELDAGKSTLAQQLAQGNQDPAQQLSPEEQALAIEQSQQQ